jgi:hypothetical protein
MARGKSRQPVARKGPRDNRTYRLEVSLLSGPVTRQFAERNPKVSRAIEVRGDQTLMQLHDAIFLAFEREEEHFHEFQLGGDGPHDPKARRYGLPMALHDPFDDGEPAGDVTRTTIGALGLSVGTVFSYWFDFGDDWWHRIDVLAIEDSVARGKYPRLVARTGESPPQYIDWDELDVS